MIEVVGARRLYGKTAAVDGASLTVEAGRLTCLLGPSGCGKSSTLRMIAGHEVVSSGDIVLGRANPHGLEKLLGSTADHILREADRPVLFAHAASIDGLQILNRTAFEDFSESDDGVVATVRNLDTGEALAVDTLKGDAITKAGRTQLKAETENWERIAGVIGRVLQPSEPG